MVGASAMGPIPLDDETPDEARERIMKRFEIGSQIMGRTGGGQIFTVDPISSVLNDRDKRSTPRILGQAYMSAHHLMAHNKDKIEKIADELTARREIYGDELVDLLGRAQLELPVVDYTDEDVAEDLSVARRARRDARRIGACT